MIFPGLCVLVHYMNVRPFMFEACGGGPASKARGGAVKESRRVGIGRLSGRCGSSQAGRERSSGHVYGGGGPGSASGAAPGRPGTSRSHVSKS